MTDREKWDSRYSFSEAQPSSPDVIVLEAIRRHAPGRGLDLACGTGRNAIALVRAGWSVVGVDISVAALSGLRQVCRDVDTVLADLTGPLPLRLDGAFDLICDCRYLQRDLFPRIFSALRPGGIFAAHIFTTDDDSLLPPFNPNYLVEPGELLAMARGLQVLSYREHKPSPGLRRYAELLTAVP